MLMQNKILSMETKMLNEEFGNFDAAHNDKLVGLEIINRPRPEEVVSRLLFSLQDFFTYVYLSLQ